PLVENAIQHGIGKHVGSDCVEVESRREGDSLCLEVRNRNSAPDASAESLRRRGIGLANTQLRLRELYGDAARFALDLWWPRGVACRLRIPYRRIEAPAAGAERAIA
ncbi:MAG TPA: sensor histidine kinase, partial [Dokdonella sp.]